MNIDIWTDGACSCNPGPGGWGAILSTTLNGKPYEKELSGGKPATTNNEMELLAVLEALEAVKARGCSIRVHTDSQLVVGYLGQGWKIKAAHLACLVSDIRDLVRRMDHSVEWVKVRGHAGDPMNERVDRLARSAIPA